MMIGSPAACANPATQNTPHSEVFIVRDGVFNYSTTDTRPESLQSIQRACEEDLDLTIPFADAEEFSLLHVSGP